MKVFSEEALVSKKTKINIKSPADPEFAESAQATAKAEPAGESAGNGASPAAMEREDNTPARDADFSALDQECDSAAHEKLKEELRAYKDRYLRTCRPVQPGRGKYIGRCFRR